MSEDTRIILAIGVLVILGAYAVGYVLVLRRRDVAEVSRAHPTAERVVEVARASGGVVQPWQAAVLAKALEFERPPSFVLPRGRTVDSLSSFDRAMGLLRAGGPVTPVDTQELAVLLDEMIDAVRVHPHAHTVADADLRRRSAGAVASAGFFHVHRGPDGTTVLAPRGVEPIGVVL